MALPIGLWTVFTTTVRSRFSHGLRQVPTRHLANRWTTGTVPPSRQSARPDPDILSIHMVLSERSQDLVGASELALMKPTSILVNTSRGPIVDEDALGEALRRMD
jgi:hypothetical protein